MTVTAKKITKIMYNVEMEEAVFNSIWKKLYKLEMWEELKAFGIDTKKRKLRGVKKNVDNVSLSCEGIEFSVKRKWSKAFDESPLSIEYGCEKMFFNQHNKRKLLYVLCDAIIDLVENNNDEFEEDFYFNNTGGYDQSHDKILVSATKNTDGDKICFTIRRDNKEVVLNTEQVLNLIMFIEYNTSYNSSLETIVKHTVDIIAIREIEKRIKELADAEQ